MSITDRRRMLSGKPFFVIFQANKVPLNSRYIKSQGENTTVAADKITVDGKLLINGAVAPKFNEYKTIHILAKATVFNPDWQDPQMRVDNQTVVSYVSSTYGTPYITVSGQTEKEYILDISPTAKGFQFWSMQYQGSNSFSTGEITKIWLEK